MDNGTNRRSLYLDSPLELDEDLNLDIDYRKMRIDTPPDYTVRNGLNTIGTLASANFSSESLPDTNSYQSLYSSSPKLNLGRPPNFGSNSPGTPPSSAFGRKFLNSSTTNPNESSTVQTKPYMGSSRVRPKSFISLDSRNYALSEEPSDSRIDHNSNSKPHRNSFHGGSSRNYVPQIGVCAPPLGPNSRASSRSSSPVRSASPSRLGRTHMRSKSPVRRSVSPVKTYLPFNFTSQDMMNLSTSPQTLKVNASQRRGHKYKHSSVSMNLFQEPSPTVKSYMQPLAIPDSYPIPNFKELLGGMSSTQRLKATCCLLHAFLSLVIFIIGVKYQISLFSTLAHLIFYNSLGSLVIVLVDIMSNYDVWSNPSIAFPFGIGRLEALIAFALNASLIMLGCDLISHSFEEFAVSFLAEDDAMKHSEGQSHHIHGHSVAKNNLVYQLVLVITIITTFATSRFILASERLSKLIAPYESSNEEHTDMKLKGTLLGELGKPSKTEESLLLHKAKTMAYMISTHPTILLTLFYCVFLMSIPFIQGGALLLLSIGLDDLAALSVACFICLIGYQVVKTQGSILLLSYPLSRYEYDLVKSMIYDEVISLGCFKPSYTIEELFLAKFNFELLVVGLKVRLPGINSDDESALRFEINRIIQRCVSQKEKGPFGSKIESTIDIFKDVKENIT